MMAFAELQRQLAQLPSVNGIAPVDVLGLPDSLATVIRKMMRGRMALAVLAGELALPLDQARQVGDAMVEKGYLISESADNNGTDSGADNDGVTYKVYFARMRGQKIAVDL